MRDEQCTDPGPPKPLDSRWSVWRQDDNGNHFRMSTGHTEEEALAVAAKFEARGHKQFYWVERDG